MPTQTLPHRMALRTPSFLCHLAALLAVLGSAMAQDLQMFRIRANGPTTITGFQPNGDITWTSTTPNLQFTVESTTGSGKKWGAVVSGVQPGLEHSTRLPIATGAGNVISVLTSYSGSPLPNYEMQLVRYAPVWEVIAKAITDNDGECFFHNVPPGGYYVGMEETPLYSSMWWDSPIVNGVRQTNVFRIHAMRQAFGLLPEGDVPAKTEFSWGLLTDCRYYQFELRGVSPTGAVDPEPIERFDDLLDTHYVPVTAFAQGNAYRWAVTGFDARARPVMNGFRYIRPLFAGTVGEPRKGNSVFGLARFSTRFIAGVPVVLLGMNSQTVAKSDSDATGWFAFRDVLPGDYWLTHQSADYSQDRILITLPDQAGHRDLPLTKRSAVNVPRHETVATRTPTFLWSGIPEAATYVFRLLGGNPLVVIHEQPGLIATAYVSPSSLADGDYFWNVTGVDLEGNTVLTAGARFTVKGP